MSEFSDCYYAYSTSITNLTSFLLKLGRYSLVFPEDNGYIPFLVDQGYDNVTLNDIVIKNYRNPLIRYFYAEDHLLNLQFYIDSILKCEIVIQQKGQSENNIFNIVEFAVDNKLIANKKKNELLSLLNKIESSNNNDLSQIRKEISEIFTIKLLEWCSCADLSYNNIKKMKEQFPEGIFLLTSKRGKITKPENIEPNEWCPVPNLPPFMYLPVPTGDFDEELLEKHFRHWVETGDFDNEKQFGFWLLTAYDKALPNKYRYLSNRIMNINASIFKDWEKELRRTIAGILAVSPKDFDWGPYLSRIKGGVHL